MHQVLLVTGGEASIGNLDSTEVMIPGSGSTIWRLISNSLPKPIHGIGVANVQNTLYILGALVSIQFDM